VSLTVTDDDGATGQTSQNVIVTAPGSGITLQATGRKVKGVRIADLTWTGANGASVDVFRNTLKLTTTTAAAYTDNTGLKGSGTFTYKVCLAGTSTCSNPVNVTW
jgi:hypothetical protein